MKYIGIDYGSKRVGVALSDEDLNFAFPLVVLDNDENLLDKVIEICQKNEAGLVVVGDSKDFSQNDNKIMEEVRPFVQKLGEAITIPVVMHPEFLTSMEAERIQGKNDMLDASAAALILKSYLDTNKNKEDDNN